MSSTFRRLEQAGTVLRTCKAPQAVATPSSSRLDVRHVDVCTRPSAVVNLEAFGGIVGSHPQEHG